MRVTLELNLDNDVDRKNYEIFMGVNRLGQALASFKTYLSENNQHGLVAEVQAKFDALLLESGFKV